MIPPATLPPIDLARPFQLALAPGRAALAAASAVATAPHLNATIMLVDDEPINNETVQLHLENAGYRRFLATTNPLEVMDLVRDHHPDTVLLDLRMPALDGFEILAQLKEAPHIRHVPVIVLTASSDAASHLRALELGAHDFLAKPVDPSELVLRLRNTLVAKAYQDHLINYSQLLEEQVRLRTAELELARTEAILCLARAGEYRDDVTGNHVIRVGRYVHVIARELGIDPNRAALLEQAAQLHDIGKIGVSDLTLLKPGKLTMEEYAQMQRHCEFGLKIIQPMADTDWQTLHGSVPAVHGGGLASSPIMRLAASIAYTHHEKWDGSGYPEGLSGARIPLEGRITAVADVYDALSTVRPYKQALPQDECFAILREGRGTHFDPQVLDAFFACQDEIVRIQHQLADAPRTKTSIS